MISLRHIEVLIDLAAREVHEREHALKLARAHLSPGHPDLAEIGTRLARAQAALAELESARSKAA